MNLHCDTCDRIKDCYYPYKPTDCYDYEKFQKDPQAVAEILNFIPNKIPADSTTQTTTSAGEVIPLVRPPSELDKLKELANLLKSDSSWLEVFHRRLLDKKFDSEKDKDYDTGSYW